jgi:tetratricopeptide (TPR) repeat protein
MYRLTAADYGNELWMQTREANAFYHAGRYDEALAVIQNVNRTRETVATLFLEARIYFMKEDYLSARQLFSKAEELLGFTGLEACENVISKAEERLLRNDFTVTEAEESSVETVKNLEKVGPLDEEDMNTITETQIPDNGWTQHYDVVKELGDCHAMVGDYRQAQECYDKAAVLAPDEAGPYVGSGVVALQTGRPEDAETAFRVAVRLDPKCSKAYCGLAMVSQQRDEIDVSFGMYLKSLEHDSNNLTALLGLFQLACRTGSFSQVIHYLEVYLDMHPGDTSVMFCLATLQLKDGRADVAQELLSKILVLDSEHTDAANLLEEVEHALAQETKKEIIL